MSSSLHITTAYMLFKRILQPFIPAERSETTHPVFIIEPDHNAVDKPLEHMSINTESCDRGMLEPESDWRSRRKRKVMSAFCIDDIIAQALVPPCPRQPCYAICLAFYRVTMMDTIPHSTSRIKITLNFTLRSK